MKNAMFFITLITLLTSIGCNDIASKRNQIQGKLTPWQDQLQAKDLSKLTAEEVIKTKYKKLQFICNYVIDASSVKDGGVTSESKNGLYVWDIVANTAFSKNVVLNDKVLNLTFIFNGAAILSLDSKFNVSLKATDKYEVKTFADDGKILTDMSSDNSSNPFTLLETQTVNLIEMSEGTSGNSIGNKIKMDCSLKSEVYSIYK